MDQNEDSLLSTPRSNRTKNSQPKFSQFTSRSSSRAQEASKIFRVKLATTNPFATHLNAIDLAWESYVESFARFFINSKSDILIAKMKKDK